MEREQFPQSDARRISAIAFVAGLRATVHVETAVRTAQAKQVPTSNPDSSTNSIRATLEGLVTEERVKQEPNDDATLFAMERSLDQE